jgi:amidohydrolase
LDALTGRIALIAVPAEEYIEVEYRNGLRQQGKLEFLAGKAEFLRLGEFDDIDLAMMTHTSSNTDEGKLTISSTNNGMIAKFIQFQGRAAHAGGAPHRGINALNAATLALNNIHAQRETFQDKDTVRVHPIITMGGASVNSVPADVRMETFVRANNLEAIADADAKVDRSLRAGAMAVGATVNITTLPGYMPMNNDDNMMSMYRNNAAYVVGEENVGKTGHRTGSTDMGDVGHVMPTIHPYAGGAIGTGHGDDYLIRDWDNAVLNAAKAMALTVVDLLADGAVGANEVKAKHQARMSIKEYLALQTGNLREETYSA